MTHAPKFALALALIAGPALASNVGVLTHPMTDNQKFITSEFTGITSSGGGVGVQLRYTQQLMAPMRLEAGVGMAGGDYSGRGFLGADFRLLEDYDVQPRVSLRTQLETNKVADDRINSMNIGPMVSKGFNFWGMEAFPFLGLPFGVNLSDNNSTYETSLQAALGATSKLNFQGWEALTVNVEALVELKDSYTGVFAGLTYGFN